MNPILLILVSTGIALLTAVALVRRLARSATQQGQSADLLPDPDPLLSLVLRANAALGVWITGPSAGANRRAVAAGLGAADAELIVARLPRWSGNEGGGTERLEHGLLVYLAADDRVIAALLPGRAPFARIETLRRDLADVLARLEREPILAAVEGVQGRPDETVESIAMRLAHQIERLLDMEVAVALARPQGLQILGVSLRSDPRFLLALAAPGSPLDQVGRGILPGPLVSDDPLGRSGKERRRARPRSLVLPIPSSQLTVGAVVIATPEGALPGGSARGELYQVLEAAGPRLLLALDRQELQETALSDPLTGLRNRRGLERAMTRVTAAEGALIYADLDRFKLLNDTLGHAAGDAALVHFARICGQATRSGDVTARIGGEEFAIWLPGATLAEGRNAAERIRSDLEAAVWAWQGRRWALTASFGVAGCPETVPRSDYLAERADAALYRAKEAGRNRVIVAE